MRLNPEISVGNLLTMVMGCVAFAVFFFKHLTALALVTQSMRVLASSQQELGESQKRIVTAQERLVADLNSIDKRLAIVETKIEERLPRLK